MTGCLTLCSAQRLATLVAVSVMFMPPARAENVCTILADASTGHVLLRQGDCDRAMPPQSTFKIPLALMGYDSGFLETATSPRLPFKQGYPDWREEWRTNIDPTAWMKESVVWYSQRITEALGKEEFADYVSAFEYGNKDVSGDKGKDNSLSRSWISSSLRITPVEQIAFLGKIVRRELPVKERAYAMTEAILEAYDLPDGWKVRGKTGAGFSVNADGSANRDHPLGWYVGWATRDQRAVVFVRLDAFSKRQKTSPGMGARDAFLEQLPSLLKGS